MKLFEADTVNDKIVLELEKENNLADTTMFKYLSVVLYNKQKGTANIQPPNRWKLLRKSKIEIQRKISTLAGRLFSKTDKLQILL